MKNDGFCFWPWSAGEEDDSMTLLTEILGDLFVDQGDSSQDWTEGSGQTDAQLKEKSFFLPSQLLDQSLKRSSVSGGNLFVV